MEQLMTEIQSILSEIQADRRSVLERFNQLNFLEGNTQCCPCNKLTEQLKKEFNALQLRYDNLKQVCTEKQSKEIKLRENVTFLQKRLCSIENMLLPKINEDSDILAALRRSCTRGESRQADRDRLISSGSEVTSSLQKQSNHSCVLQRKSVDDIPDEKTSSKTDVCLDKETISEPAATTADKNMEKDKMMDERSKESQNTLGGFDKQSGKSQRPVSDLHFQKPQRQKATLVKQNVQLVYDGESHWRFHAQQELDRNRALFFNLEGCQTAVCLDISESMAQSNGWTEAHTFLTDYLTGLANMSKYQELKTENVALVTFGHETKVQVGYTNRYDEIQKRLENIQLGGPTPMFGGMMFTLAVSFSPLRNVEHLYNGGLMFTKVIMITDGRPTELQLIAGTDTPNKSKMEETKAKILSEWCKMKEKHRDVYFVPVGRPDMDFINMMAASSGGTLLDYRHGKRFSRRQYLAAQLVDSLGMVMGIMTRGSDYNLSSEDKEDLRNIQDRTRCLMLSDASIEINNDRYTESKNKQLPSIGSRVRRGPDWHYGTQDSYGPGTVIGHAPDDEGVHVEWDTAGNQNIYHYGIGGYDVLIVDEPRVLNPGEIIAVGCEVKPGITAISQNNLFLQEMFNEVHE